MINKNIGIIGCGNMGEALVNRLSRIAKKANYKLIASDAEVTKNEKIRRRYKIALADNKALAESSGVIIVAVKPKDFDSVLNEIKGSLSRKKLLISIAAGITTKHIEGIVGNDIPVVRAMPNMPAIIGEAVSSISRGSCVSSKDMRLAQEMLSSIGETVEVDEGLVDIVTAISGSGPAYFFYLVESLIDAARELGLSEKAAKQLVIKTALGSSKLLEALKEEPAVLRAKVTSKGGTTEAAFRVFESKGFKETVKEAAREACNRSKELSKG